MTDLKLAAAYIRVSTDDQTELSPDSQLAVLREYAEKNGYIILDEHVYVDAGISGRRADKRPAFNEMIAAARQQSHPFGAILVWKFSRFARNQEESIVYKSLLRKDGVDVISVSEPLIDGPFGSLMERILEWMDEYYSIRLAGEVKRSMTLNAQQGRRQIAAPFGYMLTSADETGKRQMVPEPAEAPLVREIYRRFIAGEGLFPIAKWLNALGVKTHRGGAMENRTVEYILRNPVYIGKIRWTPSGRARRDFSNPDTLVVDGDHEAIIDDATWQAAQERMAAVKSQWGYKARPTYELKDWLGGIVRCADCGGTLIFAKPHYFKCNNYVRGRCKSTQHIKVDLLHAALLEKLNADLRSSAPLAYEVAHSSDGSAEELRRLELARDALDKKLARIRDAYASGIDSLEEYKKFRAEIDAEKEKLTVAIKELQKKQNPELVMPALRSGIEKALKVLESPDATKEQKNNAARGILVSCTFDKANMALRITYRVSI